MGDGLTVLIFGCVMASAVLFALFDWSGEDRDHGCVFVAMSVGSFGVAGLLAPMALGTCMSEPCEFVAEVGDPTSVYRTALPSMSALLIVLVSVAIFLFLLGVFGGGTAPGMAFAWAFGCFILARIAWSQDYSDHRVYAAVGVGASIALVITGIASSTLASKFNLR